jgi:hypothetical protein
VAEVVDDFVESIVVMYISRRYHSNAQESFLYKRFALPYFAFISQGVHNHCILASQYTCTHL